MTAEVGRYCLFSQVWLKFPDVELGEGRGVNLPGEKNSSLFSLYEDFPFR